MCRKVREHGTLECLSRPLSSLTCHARRRRHATASCACLSKVPLVINSSSSSSSSRVRQYLGLHARPSTSLGCSPTPSHHSRSSCQTRLRMPTRRKLILFMADGSFHVSSSLFLLHKRSCCSVVQLEVRASTDISTHFKVSISQWQLA